MRIGNRKKPFVEKAVRISVAVVMAVLCILLIIWICI